MKKCSKCKQEKPLELFCKSSVAKDGLNPWCLRCRQEYKKKWVSENSNKVIQDNHQWYSKNRDKKALMRKKYYIANKERVRALSNSWREANRSRVNKNSYRARVARMANDISFRLKILVWKRIYCALKANKGGKRTEFIIGCTIQELKAHIESLFQPGMSWENWSKDGWHLDHILPLSSFDLTNPKELKKACHYNNLQPLWAKDNLSKSNKV